jgi:hypothetical protein
LISLPEYSDKVLPMYRQHQGMEAGKLLASGYLDKDNKHGMIHE